MDRPRPWNRRRRRLQRMTRTASRRGTTAVWRYRTDTPRWGWARVPGQDQAETKSGTRISRVILLDRFIRHDVFCRSKVTADHHHDDFRSPLPPLPTRGSLPSLSSTFRFRLEKSNRSSQSSHRHPTQAMLESYPPNLESVAAPATAFATSSWPRSGCEMVSRPTALVRRSSPTIWP